MSTKADCYRIIQEIAVARDKVCQHPECNRPADCGHHLFKRDRLATAFFPEAILGVCTQHHTGWCHNKTEEFAMAMFVKMGRRYYELRRLSHTIVKNMDYNEVYRGLVAEKHWVLQAFQHGA